MRIVLVNWAKIWDGASHGGGVNGYCQALALALKARGHDVVSLFGGTTHLPPPAPCEIRRHDDWLGIRVFEVVNSPVLAPSIQQFQDPMGEVSAPELEEQVGRFFAALRPDVVHWHNIEGFSIGCVARARAAGARNFFSLHNYHTICPQVYLMRGHRIPCTDFDNGHRCATCIQAKPVTVERQERIDGYLKSIGRPPDVPPTVAQTAAELRDALRGLAAVYRAGGRLVKATLRARGIIGPRPAPPIPLPGHPLDGDGSIASPLPPSGADTRGQTQAILADLNRQPPPDFTSGPGYEPLLNVVPSEPPSDKPLNDYGRRRAAMVDMLNSCDRVLAVSDFVRRMFESRGVRPDVIRTLHIGTRINRLVAHHHRLVFDPPPFTDEPWDRQRPIRVVFMGYNHYYKGLGMFAEALDFLEPRHLGRIDLSVYALDGQSIEWMFRRLEPRLARLTFSCGYRYEDIPWMLGGKDLGVVPSVWWDNAPQTVFEFMACRLPVLGAEVGGIPDFVKEGRTGLLFRANDRRHLAQRLAEVIENPRLLNTLRAGVRPPKDIDDHAAEIEHLYTTGDIPPPSP